jgi:hypothetical protein
MLIKYKGMQLTISAEDPVLRDPQRYPVTACIVTKLKQGVIHDPETGRLTVATDTYKTVTRYPLLQILPTALDPKIQFKEAGIILVEIGANDKANTVDIFGYKYTPDKPNRMRRRITGIRQFVLDSGEILTISSVSATDEKITIFGSIPVPVPA